jgi:hypothetical protein
MAKEDDEEPQARPGRFDTCFRRREAQWVRSYEGAKLVKMAV